MIASLPMYWRSENAVAWQQYWHRVQANATSLGLPPLTAPENLPISWYDHWLRADLILSQTCGLPFRTKLKGKVAYVTTPDFGLSDCAPGHYCSVALRRKGQQDGWRLARNADDSQSGWAAALDYLTTQHRDAYSQIIDTGAHAASAHAVADGQADIACVDAVTWRLIQQHDDVASALEVVASTRPTPALPLITSLDQNPDPLRIALRAGLADTPEEDRQAMGGLRGFVDLSPEDYFRVPLPATD